MAHRRIRAGQSQAHPAQHVVPHRCEGHDQVVGVELAGRQSLHLELAVELLTGGVIAVQRHDLNVVFASSSQGFSTTSNSSA